MILLVEVRNSGTHWMQPGDFDIRTMPRTINDPAGKGISGTWFYARYLYGEPLGSDPGYLTEGWWEFTRFVAEEHRRLGMIDWFRLYKNSVTEWRRPFASIELAFRRGWVAAQLSAEPFRRRRLPWEGRQWRSPR